MLKLAPAVGTIGRRFAQTFYKTSFNFSKHFIYYSNDSSNKSNLMLKSKLKSFKKDEKEEAIESFEDELKKLALFQRYKKMFLDYWYVVLPVAGVTSIIWFSSFYLIARRYFQLSVYYLLSFTYPIIFIVALTLHH
jgi:hypothetical protein